MSSSSQDMKILSALICDDVRREDNGKEILIGVYSGSILIPTIPANIMLTAWINMEVHGPCEFDFEIRVLDPSDRQIAHGKVHVASSEAHDLSSMALPRFPINAEKEGWLKIQSRKNGGRWRNIIKRRITIAPKQNST